MENMKIKRFVGPDMRRVIAMIRDEQGPDAVILSSQAVAGGVEIVAAVDYDEDLVSRLALQNAVQTDSRSGTQAASGSEVAPEVAAKADTSDQRRRPAAKAAAEPQAEAEEAPRNTSEWLARVAEAAQQAAEPAPRQAPKPRRAEASKSKVKDAGASIQWSPDPALKAMQQELGMMKQLLQEQFAHLAWADMKTFQPRRAALMRRIKALGLEPELAGSLAADVAGIEDVGKAWREVIFNLGRRVRVAAEDPVDQGGVFALVGPTGVGKTTTIAKLAARHCLRYGPESLLLISTDGFRIGAQRQLEAFATILGVNVRQADSAEELGKLLDQYRQRRLILIDTAGMAPSDCRLAERLKLLSIRSHIRSYLVLAANMQAGVMRRAVSCFGGTALAGVALTKIDETGGLGAALSVLIGSQLPAVWLSDGQRVPEDLKSAKPVHMISWAARAQQNDDTDDLPPLWLGGAAGSSLDFQDNNNAQSNREVAGASI
jgi:flagellar biosynthesis protein FlhF